MHLGVLCVADCIDSLFHGHCAMDRLLTKLRPLIFPRSRQLASLPSHTSSSDRFRLVTLMRKGRGS